MANHSAGDKNALICVESTFLSKNKEINNTKRKSLVDKPDTIKILKTKGHLYL
ncbi:hypothetical protein UYSO10_2874 [Kosakonia radicincitans]|nr:hypothetical protein UYSO10_2874 [Kosakonia radicincitans]